jgi:hypothetical protein
MSSKVEASLGGDDDSSHQVPPEMSLKQRWIIYLAVWFIALSFMFPGGVLLLPFFPLGLLLWIDPRMDAPEKALAAIPVLWIGYWLHGVITLKSRTRLRFGILLLVLALILGLNVAG